MTSTYYDTLQVSPDATQEEILRAYRRLSHQYHPDRGGSHEMMVELNKAKECLLDPEKRHHYDTRLRRGAETPTTNGDPSFTVETMDRMSYEEVLSFFLTALAETGEVKAEPNHPSGYDILLRDARTGHLTVVRLCIWPVERAVGPTEVAQCVTGAMAGDADRAWVITNRTFSPEALRVAEKVAFDVLLTDRQALSEALDRTGMNLAAEESAAAAPGATNQRSTWHDWLQAGLPGLDREGRWYWAVHYFGSLGCRMLTHWTEGPVGCDFLVQNTRTGRKYAIRLHFERHTGHTGFWTDRVPLDEVRVCAEAAEREGASVAWVISAWQNCEAARLEGQRLCKPGQLYVHCTPITRLHGWTNKPILPRTPTLFRHIILQIPVVLLALLVAASLEAEDWEIKRVFFIIFAFTTVINWFWWWSRNRFFRTYF